MKTTKSTTVSKSNKITKTGEAVRNTRITGRRTRPTEEEIRRKAEEIYYQRVSRGEQGSATDDWRKAEELLTSA